MKNKYYLLQLMQFLYKDRYNELLPYQTYLKYKNMSLKNLWLEYSLLSYDNKYRKKEVKTCI